MRLELEKKQREEESTSLELATTNRLPLRDGPPLPLSNSSVHPNHSSHPGDPSCMASGGFTTLHYDSHDTLSTSCQPVHTAREDSLDLYAIRDDCYTNEEADNPHNQSRKPQSLHPEFNQAFQTFPSQQPTFVSSNYQDYQTYESIPSTSRPQFQQQFQSQASFSHYSPYQDPAAMQQQPCHPNQHPPAIYETFASQDDNNGGQQYTNLNSVQPMSSVVQQMGKLEPFSELLAGRYSYYGEEPAQIGNYHGNGGKIEEKVEPVGENNDDCDENFGEIIKKSMVETVSA